MTPTMQAATSPVTAIDILMEPDATMLRKAAAVNSRLRSVFPKGFALDASHQPHITMLQCFVPTANLDKVYAAAGKVLASDKVTSLKLTAHKYYFLTSPSIPGLGLSGIVMETTPDLIKVQQDLIEAVTPFTVKTGTVPAFFTTPEAPTIHQAVIDYIEVFVPEHSGEHYIPHVTTGLASIEYLNKMLAEPFESFTFSPVGVDVYQLGDYGTAARKLTALHLKP